MSRTSCGGCRLINALFRDRVANVSFRGCLARNSARGRPFRPESGARTINAESSVKLFIDSRNRRGLLTGTDPRLIAACAFYAASRSAREREIRGERNIFNRDDLFRARCAARRAFRTRCISIFSLQHVRTHARTLRTYTRARYTQRECREIYRNFFNSMLRA